VKDQLYLSNYIKINTKLLDQEMSILDIIFWQLAIFSNGYFHPEHTAFLQAIMPLNVNTSTP
jgi:hypothetical protein